MKNLAIVLFLLLLPCLLVGQSTAQGFTVGPDAEDVSLDIPELAATNVSAAFAELIALVLASGDDWGVQYVITNATLTGQGTTASPLGVDASQISTSQLNNDAGFLIGIAASAVTLNNPQFSATNVSAALDEMLSIIDASGGLSSVATNATISGNGTPGSPLGIVQGQINTSQINNDAGFLIGIAASAVTLNNPQFSATNVSAALDEMLSIIDASGGLSSVATNATLTGNGTPGSPLGIVQSQINTSQINNDAGFITRVYSNNTLTGQGTQGNTLRVNPGNINTSELNNNAGFITNANAALQQLSLVGTQLTLSQGGGTVTLPSGGGSTPWVTAGTNVYRTGGRVGIGTTAPQVTHHMEGQSTGDFVRAISSNKGLDDRYGAGYYGGIIGESGQYGSTQGGYYLRGYSYSDFPSFFMQGFVGAASPTSAALTVGGFTQGPSGNPKNTPMSGDMVITRLYAQQTMDFEFRANGKADLGNWLLRSDLPGQIGQSVGFDGTSLVPVRAPRSVLYREPFAAVSGDDTWRDISDLQIIFPSLTTVSGTVNLFYNASSGANFEVRLMISGLNGVKHAWSNIRGSAVTSPINQPLVIPGTSSSASTQLPFYHINEFNGGGALTLQYRCTNCESGIFAFVSPGSSISYTITPN